MKSLQSTIAAAYMAGWLATSSGPSLPLFASAQEQEELLITECTDENKETCAATAKRVCYNYETSATTECGPCLDDHFEFENECYDIDSIDTEDFLILARLLELYLPEYADEDVTTKERGLRLMAAARIISFWNSQVPPPEFELGLSEETFLTEEERKGRLGVSSEVSYDEDGKRGKMARFEFGSKRRLKKRSSERFRMEQRMLEDLPPAVNWDADGYTTFHKNQGLCGCCWAVAVAGAVESALMITGQTPRYDTNRKNSLSFQQMVSCDEKQLACNGGNTLQATRYVWEHDDFNNGNFGGLYHNHDWPYSDFLGKATTTCNAQAVMDTGKTPGAYLNFPKVVNDVNDRADFEERRDRLKAAVAQQPVIGTLKSGCDLFMNYKGGVLTHDNGCQCCDVNCIDHAIVIVGYNTTGPTPYWKLRNSWGSAWGEEGNFNIAMNDPGCGWGLFGMLAETALPSDAYRNLEDLPERPGWWETSATWEKVMVILFSILGFCCVGGCLAGLWNKRKA